MITRFICGGEHLIVPEMLIKARPFLNILLPMIWIKRNTTKNPNWKEENQLPFYKYGEGVKLRASKKKKKVIQSGIQILDFIVGAPLNISLNSQKWFTWIFSLWYPYVIKLTSNENTKTYLVEIVILISHQILITNLQSNL